MRSWSFPCQAERNKFINYYYYYYYYYYYSPCPPEIYLPSEMKAEPDLSFVLNEPWYEQVIP